MEMQKTAEFLTCLVWLWCVLSVPEVTAKRKETVCSSLDIRNHMSEFHKLDNCTVIEGYLQILLVETADWSAYMDYSFPDLVEITDYLLLYRMFGLKTLRYLFPNLSVIRGQNLFFDYAIVIFEMKDFEEIGLNSLTSIERGAVRLEKNYKLCYIETIDWTKISKGKKEDHFILENKSIDECVDVCPQTEDNKALCPVMNVPIDGGLVFKQPLCWDHDHCQKVCPDKCGERACYQTTNYGDTVTKCCHEHCLGGCTGESLSDCLVCKDVFYENKCLEKCPPGTSKFYNRRCILERECRNLLEYASGSKKEGRVHWKVLDSGECVRECPVGFRESKDDKHRCEQCNGPCPKECPGAVVDNVQAAQNLKGCTIINGILEIQIGGGSHIGQELEESLGLIEKVTHYVKVAMSYAILSLSFLKNLSVISGTRLYNDRYALILVDNDNLEDIWDFKTHPNLTIIHGTIFFHYNRKLCLSKIHQLMRSLGMDAENPDEKDVSQLTNGDQGACDVTHIEVEAMNVQEKFAIIRWTNYHTADHRELLGWVINYRNTSAQDITIYNARDACGVDVWKTSDIKPDTTQNATHIAAVIVDLEPFTQYALFVRSYTIATANRGAMSDILYFTTLPWVPSSPRDVTVAAKEPGRLHVHWKPPSQPNGNVTHYHVYYQPQKLDASRFDRRDYCKDRLRHSQFGKVTIEKGASNKDNLTANNKHDNESEAAECCTKCQDTEVDQELADEENRIFQIKFQDFLQNSVYKKRKYVPRYEGKSSDWDKSRGREDNEADGHRPSSSPDPPTGFAAPTRKRRSSRSQTEGLPKANHPPGIGDVNNKTLYRELLNQLGNFSQVLPNMTMWEEEEEEEEPYKLMVVYHATEVVLPNLRHFQEYNIEVIACQDYQDKGEKQCSSRAITNARTMPELKADTISTENITTSNVTGETGRILINWADPPIPNGVIITYEIELSTVGMADYKPDIYCIQHLRYKDNMGYITNTLKHGNWSYRIRATSLAGNGSWTPMLYFYVPSMEQASSFNVELVVGATVGGILLLIAIIILGVWWVAKKRFSQRIPDNVLFASVNPEYWNAGDLYVADEWEVARDKIQLIRELGQGSFGMVYEGLASGIKDNNSFKVAVKTVNENASIRDRIEFLNEASVMKAFDCNHVVKLLGVVSKGQPTLVVMELMANGDLKSFLRAHRPDYSEASDRKPPTLKEIMQMAGEIADGMAYLAAKKFVHRDLAARNCMVSGNMVVKIGDFGMTRDIYETDYYRKGGKGLLPVRWMAPESLKDGIFTSLSDVWSFGVVLWEMATLAAQPYQGLANEQVLKYVIDGGMMDKPEGCPDQLYELMCRAWQHNQANRPTFCEIIEMLIPDLNPNFKETSYFFSDENHQDQLHNASSEGEDYVGADDSRTPLTRSPKMIPHLGSRERDPLDDLEIDMDDIESQSDLSYDSRHSRSSRNSRRSRHSAACYHDDPLIANNCNCNSVERLDTQQPKGKPQSGGRVIGQWSPTVTRRTSAESLTCPPEAESAINSNEGSKGSSKSSGSGTNGYVANGRVKMIAPMNC